MSSDTTHARRRRRVRLAALTVVASLLAGTPLLAGGASPAHAEEFSELDFVAKGEYVGPIGRITSENNTIGVSSMTASSPFPGAEGSDGVRFLISNPDGSMLHEFGYIPSYTTSPDSWDPKTSAPDLFVNWQDYPKDWMGVFQAHDLILYIVLEKGGASGPSIAPLESGDKYFASRISPVQVSPYPYIAWSIPTTVSLAEASKTADSVTLTATTGTVDVHPAGKVQFTQDGQPVSGAIRDVAADGSASYTVTGLTEGQPYSFGATFTPTDSTPGFDDSTDIISTYAVSAAEAISVTPTAGGSEEPGGGGSTGGTSTTDIDFVLPELDKGAAGLVLETAPAPKVTLESAGDRAADNSWSATGALGAVTVNDDRRKAASSPWSLQAELKPFKAGEHSIPANLLSWTPKKTSGVGTVDPAKVDLGAARTLASGTAADAAKQRTVVDADLELNLPAGNTYEGGNYSAKLTLTLF